MSGIVRKPVILGMAAMLLASPTGAWADSLLPAAGGQGGAAFTAPCGNGWTMRGAKVRSGSWLDAIKPMCTGAIKPTSAADEKTVEPYHGGGGGNERQAQCFAPDYAVRGLIVTHGEGKPGLRVVSAVQLVCGHGDGQGPTVNSSSGFVSGNRLRGSQTVTMMCPPGQVATGVHGRSGTYLDQLGLICGPKTTR